MQWGQREGLVDSGEEAPCRPPPSLELGLEGVFSLATEDSLLEAAEVLALGNARPPSSSSASSKSNMVWPLDGGLYGLPGREVVEGAAAGRLVCLKMGGGEGRGTARARLRGAGTIREEMSEPLHTLHGRMEEEEEDAEDRIGTST